MTEDIASNMELMPLGLGIIVSVVLILIAIAVNGVFSFFAVIIGSAVSGYLSNNSTTYALIYGAIIGIISSFLLFTVFTLPIFIILGIFGAFMGKVLKSNI